MRYWSRTVASILATTLVVGCSHPQLRANWYLYQSAQPENASTTKPQGATQTTSEAATGSRPGAAIPTAGTGDTLYLALVNQDAEPLYLESISVEGLEQSCRNFDLAVGELRVVNLGEFSCRLPTRLRVKARGQKPFDIDLAGPLPTSLPGADEPKCLPYDPYLQRAADPLPPCTRARN